MPRASLPHYLAKMTTMEVFLTKTTEEQIWNHIEKQIEGLEEKIDGFKNDLEVLVESYYKGNPYDKYTIDDWRNQRPKSFYRGDKLKWIHDGGEEYAKSFFDMLDVFRDIRLCERAFPEWFERLTTFCMLLTEASLILMSWSCIETYDTQKARRSGKKQTQSGLRRTKYTSRIRVI
jgi:hypothetical protein